MSTSRGGPQKRKHYFSGYSAGSGSPLERVVESSSEHDGDDCAAEALASAATPEQAAALPLGTEESRFPARRAILGGTDIAPLTEAFSSRATERSVAQEAGPPPSGMQRSPLASASSPRSTGDIARPASIGTTLVAAAVAKAAAFSMEEQSPPSIASPPVTSFQMPASEVRSTAASWALKAPQTSSPDRPEDQTETTWETTGSRRQRPYSVASGTPLRKFQFTFRPIGGSYGESVLERLENFRRLFGLLNANEMLPLTLEGAALARRLLASSPAPRGGPACLAELSASMSSPSGASASASMSSDPLHSHTQSALSPKELPFASYSATWSPTSPAVPAPPVSSRSVPELPTTALPVATSMLASSSVSAESSDGSGALAAAAVAQRKISRTMIERRVREHYRYPPTHSVRNVIRRHRTIFEAACFSSAFLEAVRSNFIELLDGVLCTKASIPTEFHDRIVRRPLSHQIAEQQSVLVAKRPDLWDRIEPHLRWACPRAPSRQRASPPSPSSDPSPVSGIGFTSLEPERVRHLEQPWQHDGSGWGGAGGTYFPERGRSASMGSGAGVSSPREGTWYTGQQSVGSPTEQAELDALFGPLREIRSLESPARPTLEVQSPHLVLQRTRSFRPVAPRSDPFISDSGWEASDPTTLDDGNGAGGSLPQHPLEPEEATDPSCSVSTASSLSSASVP